MASRAKDEQRQCEASQTGQRRPADGVPPSSLDGGPAQRLLRTMGTIAMPSQICFHLPNGHKVCVNIPQLIPGPITIGDPGPVEGRPQPQPWLVGLEIRPELARDLALLAQAQTAADMLSPELRGSLHEGLRSAAEVIGARLPKGVSVEIAAR